MSFSISRDSRHKRAATGAMRAHYRKKRYYYNYFKEYSFDSKWLNGNIEFVI